MNTETIVQKQVNAYNERNISAFVECHAENVELYSFPENTPYSIGREKLKNRYKEIFESSPNLNTEILSRMVMGNIVVDHEKVTGRKGVESSIIIAIYEIENGLISKARFLRENSPT